MSRDTDPPIDWQDRVVMAGCAVVGGLWLAFIFEGLLQ